MSLKERGTYYVQWTPLPVKDDWLLRNVETGAAYPNGIGMIGQHAKRFASPEAAVQYAQKYGIVLVQ